MPRRQRKRESIRHKLIGIYCTDVEFDSLTNWSEAADADRSGFLRDHLLAACPDQFKRITTATTNP